MGFRGGEISSQVLVTGHHPPVGKGAGDRLGGEEASEAHPPDKGGDGGRGQCLSGQVGERRSEAQPPLAGPVISEQRGARELVGQG